MPKYSTSIYIKAITPITDYQKTLKAGPKQLTLTQLSRRYHKTNPSGADNFVTPKKGDPQLQRGLIIQPRRHSRKIPSHPLL